MVDDERTVEELRAEIERYKSEIADINSVVEHLIQQANQELQIWTAIQRKVSPTEVPHFPGAHISAKFTPGMKSGGDYFEFFELNDKMTLGIIISSANGYGLSATLMSILIKYTSRPEIQKFQSPEDVVRAIVDELHPICGDQEEASLIFGYLDRRNFEFRYCHLGNIFGMHSSQGRNIRIEPDSAPITKNHKPNILTHLLPLNAKDRLTFATEGILQSINKETGRPFGTEGLMRCLQRVPKTGAHNLRNEVFYQLEQWQSSEPTDRDQTLLVLEVDERVLKLAKKTKANEET